MGKIDHAKILRKMFDQEPPPCLKFDCVRYNDCRDKLLACESFHYYVITGESLVPSTGFKNRRTFESKCRPTHKKFEQVFRENDNKNGDEDGVVVYYH